MKTIYTFLLFSLFLPILVLGQSSVPNKNDRVVYVKNTLTAEGNFKEAGRSLLELELIIESKDSDFGTIQSAGFIARDQLGTSHVQVIDIFVKDSLVRITSKSRPNDVYNNKSINSNSKPQKDVVYRKARFGGNGLFGNMETVAKLIPGEIYYSK